jgi:hypothetical protein
MVDLYLSGLRKHDGRSVNPIVVPQCNQYPSSQTLKRFLFEQHILEEAKAREYDHHMHHSGDSAYEKPYINSPTYDANLALIAILV